MHTSIRHSAQTLLARSLWLRNRSQGKTSSTHGSSCCLWLPYLRCGCHHSCDWNGQVGPRRGTTTGRWDGTASVSVDTKLTNAEHSMRPITRNTVKMVAELYYGTALHSAVDNSCKVVAADPLSLIPLSP